ncbi:MAG TPA: hypothetical protein VIR01_17945 [Pyrinomonadaceae bacterium]|jgi:hypothetical protein
MKLKKQIAVIVLALTATTSPVWSQDRQALPSRTAHTLQGTWRVIKHGVNCQTGEELSSFPALVTFNQDGTLHGDFVGPGGTAAESTAEHGVWSRQGPDYSFRSVSYGWDPNTGAFEGRAEFTAIVQLTSVNTFTYNISVCIYDADGNQLFCGCGRAEGTRFE